MATWVDNKRCFLLTIMEYGLGLEMYGACKAVACWADCFKAKTDTGVYGRHRIQEGVTLSRRLA
jgi:hypothetical protein